MAPPLSNERPFGRALRTILNQAEDMAAAGRQPLLSTHILLTFYTVYNPAADLLRQFGVRLEHLSHLSRTNQTESQQTLDHLHHQAKMLAASCHQQTITSVHMLAALAQAPESLAHRSLGTLGVDTNKLFDAAMNKAMEDRHHTPLPTRPSTDEHRTANVNASRRSYVLGLEEMSSSATMEEPSNASRIREINRNKLAQRSSPVHPALRDSWLRTTPSGGVQALKREDVQVGVGRTVHSNVSTQYNKRMARGVLTMDTQNVHMPEPPAQVPAAPSLTPTRKSLKDRFAERKAEIRRRKQNQQNATPSVKKPKRTQKVQKVQKAQEDEEHVFVLPSTRKPKPKRSPPPPPMAPPVMARAPEKKDEEPTKVKAPSEPESAGPIKDDTSKSEAIHDARNTTRSLAARLFAKKDASKVEEKPATPPSDVKKTKARRKPDPTLAAHYRLDPQMYPLLTKFGRNLTEEAALARIDPVVGRDDEVTRVIDILGKRRGNNPLLVGEPGVGKTALVEGLAQRFCELAQRNNRLGKRTIIELELGRLLSGTHLRGAFSERLIAIKDEVRQADGDIIIFLDEIHLWMNASQSGDGADAAGELKTALARGQFPCIGATTADEHVRFVETDMAFQRRFQLVQVDEPDMETALIIAHGVRQQYEAHHGISLSDEALKAAVHLSHRYIQNRQLPDKALNVIDMASSRAARHDKRSIDELDIAHVVAEMSGLPVDRLTQSDRERFLDIEKHLANAVVGHEKVIHTIAEVLRRNYAGFRSHRPIGTMLFLGPTGVGKTEMVKALADFLFHDREAIVRLDMSEFMEAHAVSRFIGAPPGYVGYEQGGQLTEAVRRSPYQVVLLDEVEKAHPDILNILLQLFDEGCLTDGRGRKVDFSNTLIIMTSNLGSQAFDQQGNDDNKQRIGFGKKNSFSLSSAKSQRLRDQVKESARDHFTPELWNRIEERLVFMPLQRDEVAKIADLQLQDSSKRLRLDSGIGFDYDPCVIDLLIEHGGYDPQFGARPMRQTIQRLIESNVARLILAGKLTRGDTIHITVKRGELQFQRVK